MPSGNLHCVAEPLANDVQRQSFFEFSRTYVSVVSEEAWDGVGDASTLQNSYRFRPQVAVAINLGKDLAKNTQFKRLVGASS